jgi:prevent-host-death family protein
MQCNMLDAKNKLSKLVQAALAGEDVIIANKGVPVVRLVKIGKQNSTRKPGAWATLPKAKADWDSVKTNAAIADKLTRGGKF